MKIAVLVSGGVDSSVALRLLKEEGHDVTAFYLKIWLEDELSSLGTCPWEEDLQYVHAVCEQAGVPLEIISLQQEYWQEVVRHTIAEVKAGRTPNPDILCNQRVKFGAFFKKIDNSFDKIASGHYAQLACEDGIYKLHATPDLVKDQTYFLSFLTQEQLARLVFPLGHLTKPEVRAYAQKFDLPNKLRKDSQGICFLGKIKFDEFVKFHCGSQPGPLIDYDTGKVVGEHQGFWYYTIGQRQGIGLSGGPWYVVKKDTHENKVFISRTYYAPEKSRSTFLIGSCNWISGVFPEQKRLEVKLRHGAERVGCTLVQQGTGVNVVLDERDQGIAPGQYAVFYDNNLCLGAGVIQEHV